jgi:flagellar basal body P-ring formation protein FlgA
MGRVLLFLLAWLVLPASAGQRVSITLLPLAQVVGPTIRLGEIARLHSSDLDLMRQLVGLELGQAPRPGATAVIQVRHLAAWIERRAPVRADEVDWAGAQESRVERQAASLSGDEIARIARAEVLAMVPRESVAPEVSAASIPRDLQVPRGPVRLHARAAHGTRLGARVLVWVDVWVADAFVRSVPVSFHVPGWERLRMPLQGALPANDSAAASPPGVDSGSSRPAVERGETAALRSVAGAVQLESRVQVLEDGRVGDLVRVRQQGATTLLSARVTGPGQVEVAP